MADPGGVGKVESARPRGGDRPQASAPALSAQELCRDHADRVYQFASMVAGGDLEADDLAQTALEHAVRALPRFDPDRGEVTAWLWRIVVNAARDHHRAARRRELLLLRLRMVGGGDRHVDEVAEPPGISDERLVEGVRKLSNLQREVVALRYGADLEWSDVATALGVSRAAAAAAGHRALVALRGVLVEGSPPHGVARPQLDRATEPEDRR